MTSGWAQIAHILDTLSYTWNAMGTFAIVGPGLSHAGYWFIIGLVVCDSWGMMANHPYPSLVYGVSKYRFRRGFQALVLYIKGPGRHTSASKKYL